MKKNSILRLSGSLGKGVVLFFALLLSSSQLYGQQQLTVSGTVSDAQGPLIGATVQVSGTQEGTITDIDGRFTLENVASDAVLLISYLGYQEQSVNVNGRTTLNVVLEPDVNQLDEIVVIGYQSVRRSDLTGATAVIDPERSNKNIANSLAESLQGLEAGVTVRNGGQPGQNARIEIRGVSSFVNSDPLYIIDGMIADANQTFNNNDIESIQILKDASAAAIYGSRAANGVVIITTKSGGKGPLKIAVSANTGIQEVPRTWDLTNNREFAELQRTSYTNSGLTPPPSVGDNFDPSINTDWQEEILRTGHIIDLNINASGGGENASYYISGSHFENQGSLIGRSFSRTAVRINTEARRGIVTFGENIVLTNSNTRQPLPSFDTGNPFFDMAVMLPVIPVREKGTSPTTTPGVGE
jgi:TonB-linked SusC/RagA family outer membrane protein